jgi:hypothetical protein
MKKQILTLGFVLLAISLNGQVYKTIQVTTPGTLGELLSSDEKSTVTHLIVTGIIDSADFITIRDSMPEIRSLDLSGASTVNNALPRLALSEIELLQSVQLPQSITRIGRESLMSTAITEIIIPPTVTLIEHAAFRYCPLKQITIPASVKSIGTTVFSPCDSLKAIFVEEGNSAYCGIDGVLFSRDTALLVACPPARKGNYHIPSPVNEIGYEGFASCRWIDTLFVPALVSKTGTFSFASCISLKYIQVDETSAFMRDDDGVLYTKDLSTLIRYPISKPDTSYTILPGTKTIGTGSFENCKILTRISFPITLNKIESSAFRYARNITSMELPPSVEIIENAAFFYCRSMKKIRIPSSVSTIEPLFLYGDESLDTIMVNSSEPVELFPWSDYFDGVDTNACLLMVPFGSSDAYRNSIRWNSFAHIEEYNTGLEVSPTQFNIGAAGGKTAFFTITSNTEWRIRSNEAWLQFSDTLGMNNKIVTITAEPNTGSGFRQAIADLMPLEKETISLYITQEGLPTNDEEHADKISGLFYDTSLKFIVAKGMLNQTLSVYTLDGRLIASHYIDEDIKRIFVGSLPEGFYIASVNNKTLKILIRD